MEGKGVKSERGWECMRREKIPQVLLPKVEMKGRGEKEGSLSEVVSGN